MKHNKKSVIILFDPWKRKEFTQAQFKSLQVLILRLMDRYNLTKENVYGHNHYNKLKSCPNFNVAETLKDI